MLDVKEDNEGVVLAVRVQPRGSRNAIEGEWNGALKVRLTAPPTEGRANEALCRLLAAQLKIPVSAVRILAGASSRNKRVQLCGVRAEQVRKLAAGES